MLLFDFPKFSLLKHFFFPSEWSLKAKQLTLPLFALLKNKNKKKRLIKAASQLPRNIFNANEIRAEASLEGRYNVNTISIITLINSYRCVFGSHQNVNFYLKHQSTTPEITVDFHHCCCQTELTAFMVNSRVSLACGVAAASPYPTRKVGVLLSPQPL